MEKGLLIKYFNLGAIILIQQIDHFKKYQKNQLAKPQWISIGVCFYPLQILLDPVHWPDPVHGLEGQVEGRLAFEAGECCNSFDGGAQVCAFAKEIGRMPNTKRIAVEWKGGLQLLVEAFGDALLGDIERNGDVVLGKIFF